MMKKHHIIFFDGECPLCNRSVRFILKVDRKGIFVFAPLNGKIAHNELKDFKQKDPARDTLILLQGYKTEHQQLFVEGRAVLKICWLLGGTYRLLGILSFLPSALFDGIYRFVANRRYRIFKTKIPLPKDGLEDRFLP